MASPPFVIDITQPQDTGIVSQYPANERTTRDNIKSWLLVDHNTNGDHTQVTFAQKATPAAPGAGLSQLYAATDGTLHIISGAAGTDEVVVPTGTVVPFAGQTLPVGWLWCNAAAVSRTTYARLFSAISTAFGVGDGVTTFNVPDLRNGTVFGVDGTGMGGVANTNRLTSASGFGANNTWGTAGGAETQTLAQSNLPNSPINVSAVQSNLLLTGGATAFTVVTQLANDATGNFLAITHLGGASVPVPTVPAGLLMGWIIKW